MAAGERERDLDDREARADERDAARAEVRREEQDLLDAADERDERADDRDSQAVERDLEADRHAFLTSSGYGEDLPARRHAAGDRSESRRDRTAAASDRSRLTGSGRDAAVGSGTAADSTDDDETRVGGAGGPARGDGAA